MEGQSGDVLAPRRQSLQELQKECAVLESVLSSGDRPQLYRHHIFYRRAVVALRTTSRIAQRNLSALRGLQNRPRQVERTANACMTANARLRRAAEAAVAEASCSRIDTCGLSMVMLASLSRLGCLCDEFVAGLAENNDGAAARRVRRALDPTYLAQLPRMRERRKAAARIPPPAKGPRGRRRAGKMDDAGGPTSLGRLLDLLSSRAPSAPA